MSPRRRTPDTRRGELIEAARTVFAAKGVSATTVSDIVRAAGAAQGTFYLYFEGKTDLVNVIVEESTDAVIASIEAAIGSPDMGALEKLAAATAAFIEMSDEPHEIELLRLFHLPENAAFHDHVTRSVVSRVTPLLARVIEQGGREGVFARDIDPTLCASFILGSLMYVESGALGALDPETLMRELHRFALRGLGCAPEGSTS